jgi:hypothetical protein
MWNPCKLGLVAIAAARDKVERSDGKRGVMRLRQMVIERGYRALRAERTATLGGKEYVVVDPAARSALLCHPIGVNRFHFGGRHRAVDQRLPDDLIETLRLSGCFVIIRGIDNRLRRGDEPRFEGRISNPTDASRKCNFD